MRRWSIVLLGLFNLLLSPGLGEARQDNDGGIGALERALARQPIVYTRGRSLEDGWGTDCSGLVQFLTRHIFGVELPRTSGEQSRVGRVVSRRLDFSRLRPGDLLFFRDGGRQVGHVGLYLGERRLLHASRHRGRVVISDLGESYYRENFVAATRVKEGQDDQESRMVARMAPPPPEKGSGADMPLRPPGEWLMKLRLRFGLFSPPDGLLLPILKPAGPWS